MNDATGSGLALSLYESLLDGSGLLVAVQRLADELGASAHAVHQVTYRKGRPAGSISAGRGGISAEAMEDYARFWVRHDPWARAGVNLPVGVHDIADHVPPGELARSRLWNEWGKPNGAAFHALGVVLQREEALSGGLFFHRREDEPPFGAREKATAEALLPHLRRVFAAEVVLATRRDEAAPGLRAALDHLSDGVALLDAERRLAFVNVALRGMVAQRDGLALCAQGGLDTADAKSRHALGRAVTAALAALDGQVGLLPFAGSLAVPRPSRGAPWLLRAVPVLRADRNEVPSGFRGVMLMVTDSERRAKPNPILLQRLYDLTPAQASLAAAVAAGKSPQDHAALRGISLRTVQGHLATIRRKTGCRTQSDLTALLARLPA